MRSALQFCGVTGGGEGIVEGVTLFPAGRQRVAGCRIEDPADFCRKMPDAFGVEVRGKRTGVLGLGKSAAKRAVHIGRVNGA